MNWKFFAKFKVFRGIVERVKKRRDKNLSAFKFIFPHTHIWGFLIFCTGQSIEELCQISDFFSPILASLGPDWPKNVSGIDILNHQGYQRIAFLKVTHRSSNSYFKNVNFIFTHSSFKINVISLRTKH